MTQMTLLKTPVIAFSSVLLLLSGCGKQDAEPDSVLELSNTQSSAPGMNWQEAEIKVNCLVSRIGVVSQQAGDQSEMDQPMKKINDLIDSINLNGLTKAQKQQLQTRISHAKAEAAQQFYGYITADADFANFSEIDRQQAKLRNWAAR